MKNLFLLNRLGFNPDLTTRQSRVDSVSIASRYRVLAILLLFFTIGSGNVWGETITLTAATLDLGGSYTSSSKDVSNVTFQWVDLCKQTYIQAKASSGELWNTKVVPGKITNVSTTNNGTSRTSTLYWGTTAKPTTNSSSINGTSSTNSPANSCFGYIHIKRGSNAQKWTKVVITYTPATITLSESSITGLNYAVGGGPSAAQTFTVSGSNIPANLTVTAPTNFEVSLDGSSWASSKTINVTLTGSASAGTLSSTTVYVRLASGKSAGNYSGNVSIAMAGCNTISSVNPKTVAVSGTVSAASCTTNPTVTAASNSSVTATTATVTCSSGISSLGSAGCSITDYGFVIGTSANPAIGGSGVTKHQVGTTYTVAGTSFSKNLTELSAETTYYVRPYATNGNGTAYGSQFSFTTLAACTAAPTVTAGSKGTITSTTAAVTCSSGISSLGTGGCSISSYGFAVGTSSNPTIGGTLTTGGKTYEVGQTYTTTGTSFNTSVTGLTEGTLYYVRPYATNGYNTGYGAQVSFGTPKITVSETSRAFGERAVGGSYTMTFTVSGTYLQSNISIAKSGTNQTMFSIDNVTVTQTDGTAPTTTITVTYSPSTAGSHSATLTLTSTNATNKTVSLSGTGKWTVTFLNGNGGTHSTSLVANSTAPSKPGSNPAACDATSTTFIGWTQSAWSGKQNQSFIDGRTAANVKVYTSSDNLPAMTSDITYYPVFAKGSTTPSTSYAAITSGLETNKYVIAYSYNGGTQIVLKNTADGTNASTMLEGYNLSLSSSKYSNPDAAYIWELQAQADGSYYIYNTTIEKYVNATTTALTLSSTPTKFTITYDSSNSRWTIQLKDNTSYYVHGYVSGSAYDFRCTTSGSGAKYRVYLYKNESQTTYSDYLTTCCAKNVALSASATNGTVAFTVSSSPVTSIATCGGDKEVTMTITPAAGYKLTAYSSNTGTVSPSNTDPAVATSGASSKSAQEITLTFDENANGTCTIATTFTAMKDTYKDQLHGDVNTTFDGDGKEYSATYTVPNLTNPSKGSGDCESEHYKFVGWVESSYVKSDGTLNSGYTLYTAGSSGTASEKTYIAIWAKEL